MSVCDFVVNTHDSFSYTSDAAAIGISSVVYTGNNIDKKNAMIVINCLKSVIKKDMLLICKKQWQKSLKKNRLKLYQ